MGKSKCAPNHEELQQTDKIVRLIFSAFYEIVEAGTVNISAWCFRSGEPFAGDGSNLSNPEARKTRGLFSKDVEKECSL